MPRGRKPKVTKSENSTLPESLDNNQSKLSMVLGALIVLVVGILIFNYFNKNKADLGPAQNTEMTQGDVAPENLPGKYTIKEGDTLFLIAESYYKNGDKFNELAEANNISDVNAITVGQVIDIPKLNEEVAPAPMEPSVAPSESPIVSATPAPTEEPQVQEVQDTTVWGSTIDGDTYTVVDGDWLSTIAARAYGDPLAFQKIADFNNISNPDLILPGQVVKLPR